MSEDARYYLNQCCGVNTALKLSRDDAVGGGQPWPSSVPTICIGCETEANARQIERWEYERIQAPIDDCKNCGQGIVFIPDRLEWTHHDPDEDASELAPDYGVKECETVLAQALGMPVSGYAGMVADPADTHVTVDLQTGVSTPASQEALQQVVGDQTQYNPRIKNKPGEPLEIEVDLPDNATEEQHQEAMQEAIEKVFPGFGRSLG